MSDFTTWRSLVDGEEIGVIPDSVVTRPDDGRTTSNFDALGVVIDIEDEWPSIGVRMSTNMDGSGGDGNPTRLRIYDPVDDEFIKTDSGLSLSAGDTHVFDDVNLNPEQNYQIVADRDGDEFTVGFNDDPDFPYVSDDGKISMVEAVDDPPDTRSDNVWIFDQIGNVGFD